MTRAVAVLAALCLSGCGLPAAAIGTIIGAGIQATFHILDDSTDLYLYQKTGTYPGEPVKPAPAPPAATP